MSEIKRQIFSFLFALLCLLSSMQVVLNYHFCSDKLVSTSINEMEERCCMPVDQQEEQIENCCTESECCDDLKLIKTTQEFTSNESKSILDFNLLNQISVFDPVLSFSEIHNKTTKSEGPFIIRDFRQQFCVYRI